MKNRKLVVVAFLLVSAMVLGVGYAALNDTLDITGSADVSQSETEKVFDGDLYFSGAVANDTGNTTSINADNNDKVSFTVTSLAQEGDKASFTFTIKNTSEHYNADVTPAIAANGGNTNSEYFAISSDWGGTLHTVPAKGELTYTVTVELIKAPLESVSGSFLIELKAVAATVANASN